MNTISFGKRERRRFMAAGQLNAWVPEVGPAVYAVTYKKDPGGRPGSHTVLYFGEADDLCSQAHTINNFVGNWWKKFGRDDSELYICIHPMPGSSPNERAEIQHQLIQEYDPQAN